MTRIDVYVDDANDGPVLAGSATVARARDAGHGVPTLAEVDFLLGVNDTTRQDALLDGGSGSLVGARDGAVSDYLEVVEGIADHGSDVDADLVELWRRIAFSVAINNTDDHLRNHGFLHASRGWKLSPLFDVNPERSPYDCAQRRDAGRGMPQVPLHNLGQLRSPTEVGRGILA